MAVNSTQVAFECAAEFSNTSKQQEGIATIFKAWIDAAVSGGAVAEDAYAAMRSAAEICDDYCPTKVITAEADRILASLIAFEFDVVPNIVGLTATAADIAIHAAGMTVGTITAAPGTLNVVLSQGTVAGTLAVAGAALDYVKGNTP
jgi:hypothetical protein